MQGFSLRRPLAQMGPAACVVLGLSLAGCAHSDGGYEATLGSMERHSIKDTPADIAVAPPPRAADAPTPRVTTVRPERPSPGPVTTQEEKRTALARPETPPPPAPPVAQQERRPPLARPELPPPRPTAPDQERTAVPRVERPAVPPGPTQEQTVCGNIDGCLTQLKALLEDPDRGWIRQPVTPAGFASGVRLFAYRALRTQLACSDLAQALTEIDTGVKALADPAIAATVRPDQMARVRSLSAQVEEELRGEVVRRCKPGFLNLPERAASAAPLEAPANETTQPKTER